MATAAVNMLQAASRAGVDSVVAVPEHSGPDGESSHALIDLLEPAGVSVRLMPALSWPRSAAYRWGMSPAQIVWLARHVREFDLVHVHGIWGMAPLGGLVAGQMAGKPIVVTAHESLTTFDIDGSRTSARRRQKRLLKAFYLRYATLFVLTSEVEARTSLPTATRRRVVHYPVVDELRAIPPLRPRGQNRELRVGFLARIDPKKNLHLLIDAMPRLADHVRLIVAGTGPPALVNTLRLRAARLGVSDRIEWLGFVEPDDRPHLFANLDLLAMPSAFESFGLAAAEAMLYGVPVLVSEQTGVAEVLKRHGAGHITGADVLGIAHAIRALDTDRGLLRETGPRGQAAVMQELSFARIGQALYDAYEDADRRHLTHTGSDSTGLRFT